MTAMSQALAAPRARTAPHRRPARSVLWVSSVLYAAVLFAGVYYALVGDDPQPPLRTAGFVVAVAGLFALDAAERQHFRRTSAALPAATAAGLLVARLALFFAVAACDGAGLSRVLFVLVPFTAYFAFGRRASLVLGAGCAGALLAWYVLAVDGWYADAEAISDLLMFGLGLVLAVSMATVATGEQEARGRVESAVRELTDSHRRLEEYAARVAELSTARERNRLAREIHDSLGHHLTAIAVQLEKAEAFRDLDRAAADRALVDARWSARRALEEVRQSVRALRDEAEPFALSAALADLVRHIDDGSPRVTLHIEGSEVGYDAGQLTALYRAAQEGLTNARRHADAAHVKVSVAYGSSHVRLVVADDGSGIGDPAAPGAAPGFGLRGLRERVQLLGGELDIESAAGAGTTLGVTLPRTTPAGNGTVPTGRTR
ncbi:sensor histidine kinase [Streptomyces lasiicapitis]|uniref:sensor histidine kinase n=1 Tax=Streptomyces lasiicapitis TaxID=1923961 RepID=UPI0033207589